MTAEAILTTLKQQLQTAIKGLDDHLKKVTDTGTMWRRAAYKEVLQAIEHLEREP